MNRVAVPIEAVDPEGDEVTITINDAGQIATENYASDDIVAADFGIDASEVKAAVAYEWAAA